VVIGLRMGLEKDLRIASVFQRLNRVIHESTLSSKFISVFYAELEKDGTLTYVNAGHPGPMLVSRDSVERLTVGGTVIGPLPEVRFKRGLAILPAEACLVMCTDGILERRNRSDEFYGETSAGPPRTSSTRCSRSARRSAKRALSTTTPPWSS
jgi:serine phosphatase RsbU (regulator of sigma subunit)